MPRASERWRRGAQAAGRMPVDHGGGVGWPTPRVHVSRPRCPRKRGRWQPQAGGWVCYGSTLSGLRAHFTAQVSGLVDAALALQVPGVPPCDAATPALCETPPVLQWCDSHPSDPACLPPIPPQSGDCGGVYVYEVAALGDAPAHYAVASAAVPETGYLPAGSRVMVGGVERPLLPVATTPAVATGADDSSLTYLDPRPALVSYDGSTGAAVLRDGAAIPLYQRDGGCSWQGALTCSAGVLTGTLVGPGSLTECSTT